MRGEVEPQCGKHLRATLTWSLATVTDQHRRATPLGLTSLPLARDGLQSIDATGSRVLAT